MRKTELSERKSEILAAIVDQYVRTGEPVGSKKLVEQLNNAVSSATIRNEMMELVSAGYLEQPHTSAGRIPTAKGFRLYIDRLMRRRPLAEADKRHIDQMLDACAGDPERLREDAAQALANATGCAAVTTSPDRPKVTVRRIEVLRMSAHTAALLLMTDSGVLRSRVCRFEGDIGDDVLERLSRALNEELVGRELCAIGLPRIQGILPLLGEYGLQCASALTAFAELVRDSAEAEVTLTGQMNLLRHPDYQMDRARSLLDFLLEREQLIQMLAAHPGGLRVVLGSESRLPELDGSSIIVTRYMPGNNARGSIGIIGPQRMDYPAVIARLEYFATALGRMMKEYMEE